MKTLLARASKIGARFAVIIGDNELARGVVQLARPEAKHAARSCRGRRRTPPVAICGIAQILDRYNCEG